MTDAYLPSESARSLAEAARSCTASDGLRGLSLRAVAHRAGTSLNVLTYQVGDKAQLLAQLVKLLREEQAAAHREWLARVEALRPLDAPSLAAVVEAFLEDATLRRRDSVIAAQELLIAAVWNPAGFPDLPPLLEDQDLFWSAVCADRPAGAALGAAIAGYCRDELPFTLALASDPDYRLLRVTTIQRLAHGLAGQACGLASRFDAIEATLARTAGEVARTLDLEPGSRRMNMAHQAADVLMDQGIAAISHRAVAAHAGLPNSTVAHHFRTRNDLLQAAVEALYLRMQDDLEKLRQFKSIEPQGGSMAVLLATHAIALEATRSPELRPFAIDMRRQRSVNVREAYAKRLAGAKGLDRAATQAAVMAAIGILLSASVSGDHDLSTTDAGLDLLAAVRTATERT